MYIVHLMAGNYDKNGRDFLGGLKAALAWIRNPVSEDGAKQIFRMVYSMGAPEIHSLARDMRDDPSVAALLAEGSSLSDALSDMPTLAKMPPGSMGRVYHDFMDGDDIFPGYVLAGLAYKDGHFDRLAEWDEDARWLIERMGSTHDITHVLGGYGSDFPGEASS